ncbi:MAG TPA: HAD-IIB family hydrolase [Burkholderiales bacterium]|nr:HAD-IIB family hydrolase [Burkholderiales bacterium]
MQPLDRLPESSLASVRGVFADIDDTLTTDGKLTAEAYAALASLHAAGFLVVPITGRPAGWCDHIAHMWPVDAVVGENGAFYFAYDRATRKLVMRFRDTDPVRAAHRDRLAAVRDRVLAEVPGTALASDQRYREADLAIDYCEDVPRLDDAAVDRIVAIMCEAGMTAKVSSIHVNGWFGVYDKLGMTKTLLRERFGVDLDAERDRYLFAGDSPNDAPMFAYFPVSVGVANVRRFAARLEHAPAYVTASESGAGFAELAARLLAARGA